MRAQLVPLDGGPPIELTRDLVVIGRKEDCDLRLDHKSVSKMHCVLVKTDGLLLLRDLGSTNGTRVNGARVRRAALLPNDQLGIAHFKFTVQLGPDAVGPAPAAPAAPAAHEQTQALGPGEVAELLRQAHARAQGGESDSEIVSPPQEPVQRNQLPDVYPDDHSGHA